MTTPTADLTRHTTVRDGVTRWTLTGPAGSVVLSSYDMAGAAGIDYHWRTPLFDGDTPGTCEHVDYPCYGDGGSTAARRVVAQWRHGGYDNAVVWAELERWYRDQVARDQADADATALDRASADIARAEETIRSLGPVVARLTIVDADATADRPQPRDEDQADVDKHGFPEPCAVCSGTASGCPSCRP